MFSYQVDLYRLLPVLLIVDAGVVDNYVQATKEVHGALEGV